MKQYWGIVLSVSLVLSLAFNVFVVIKTDSDISQRTSNTITEILRCIRETKECLQNLIDNEDPSYQSEMMYVINGKFSTLYHLCHANRDVYSSACSNFEYIGATFIGSASTRNFVTTGIYEDFEITENEYAYVEELITLLNKASENITGSNAKDDLNALNSNFEDMHEQLYDTEHSPYRFIKKQPQK